MKGFDAVGFIMDYEEGNLNDDDIVNGFQHLLDSGLVWQLQGSYQRMANAMLEAGLIKRSHERWADGN